MSRACPGDWTVSTSGAPSLTVPSFMAAMDQVSPSISSTPACATRMQILRDGRRLVSTTTEATARIAMAMAPMSPGPSGAEAWAWRREFNWSRFGS